MYMSVLLAWMSVGAWCPFRSEQVVRTLEITFDEQLWVVIWCLDLDKTPLQKQEMHLTTELSLQFLLLTFIGWFK